MGCHPCLPILDLMTLIFHELSTSLHFFDFVIFPFISFNFPSMSLHLHVLLALLVFLTFPIGFLCFPSVFPHFPHISLHFLEFPLILHFLSGIAKLGSAKTYGDKICSSCLSCVGGLAPLSSLWGVRQNLD
mgnify:CR=1 FL=1